MLGLGSRLLKRFAKGNRSKAHAVPQGSILENHSHSIRPKPMTSELLNALAQTTLATGFTFLCTAAGAAAIFFMKPGNGRGRGAELAETLSLGFAAGIMIAASVWSLIIPAQEMAQAQGGTPWLAAGSGVAAARSS